MRCIVILLLLCSSYCLGQNKVNEHGQRVGHWRTWVDEHRCFSEGNYKVVHMRQYNIIHIQPTNGPYKRMDLWHKGKRENIIIESVAGDSFSVQDGNWIKTDTAGGLWISEDYHNGILLRTKYFDKAGNLWQHSYTDFTTKSVVEVTYADGHVLQRCIYPYVKGKYNCSNHYPDSKLNFSRREPHFSINFLSHPVDEDSVTITARDAITIRQFNCKNYITVLDKQHKPLHPPITLNKKDSLSLIIQYAPSAANFVRLDTISVVSSDTVNYKIFCSSSGIHINAENYRSLGTLTLSKSNDKYLFFKGCGSVSGYELIDSKGKVNALEYNEDGNNGSIKLADYSTGIYTLKVVMDDCWGTGIIEFTIVD